MTALPTARSAPPAQGTGGRRGPGHAMRQSATVAWRQLVQIKHNPEQLVEVGIQPVMFVVLFAFVLAGQMAGSRHAYLQFVVPGLIVQSAVLVTARTAIATNTDVTKGLFDRFRSLPISRTAPLIGRIAADYVMLVWSVVLLLAAGMLLSFRIETSWTRLIPMFLLLLVFTFALSWASVLAGLLASNPENVQALAFGLMLPLTFISNAFVRVETMPGWLQAIVTYNPVSMLADSIRGLLVAGPVAEPVTKTLIASALLLVVFAPLALRAYHRER
ncbi:ABC transporter permease [Streptomyces tubbatahanensis]|uniref:Transport permease protein n=1 Tax=Streptomyces tubbatahanensis TaxID=2923272 RepID=A0ABY3XKN4_9ACTN|nr:ABC transporter permease [Streptomyces tubbatahanensis]UNS95023.1 ABC transporter permease [Streptomyces tubbatahanensis]UNT00805.1 ABC transporter permease [Streptomyces tubbatahanensis]